MTPNPVSNLSNQEKWKKALLQGVLGLFVVGFLTIVIFMFEPPNWLTGLLCLGNILWFSALPIMLVALLAKAPFPDKEHRATIKEPIKFEDIMAEGYWPVEWREPQEKVEEPVTPDANDPTWMFLPVALIILIMTVLLLVLLARGVG